jgi:hypothetical protein
MLSGWSKQGIARAGCETIRRTLTDGTIALFPSCEAVACVGMLRDDNRRDGICIAVQIGLENQTGFSGPLFSSARHFRSGPYV